MEEVITGILISKLFMKEKDSNASYVPLNFEGMNLCGITLTMFTVDTSAHSAVRASIAAYYWNNTNAPQGLKISAMISPLLITTLVNIVTRTPSSLVASLSTSQSIIPGIRMSAPASKCAPLMRYSFVFKGLCLMKKTVLQNHTMECFDV